MDRNQKLSTIPQATLYLDDDSPCSADNFDGDDDDSLRSGIYMLGLSKSYVPTWSPRDAFRELYQNWFVRTRKAYIHADLTRKDAIIGRFRLEPRSFTPVIHENTSHIEITVRSLQTTENGSTTQKLLGYIRFDKKAGTVEITNFKAALDVKHLSLGISEKRNQDKFAGTHGEGFKLAALVLCRTGLAVRFTSSSFYWNFGFRGKLHPTLYCRLSQVKDSKLQGLQKHYKTQATRPNFERGLSSNVWEDVTVRIAQPRGQHGVAVPVQDFKSWMQVVLELDSPASDKIFHAEQGDLILETRFKGLVYLKGLQIAGHEVEYLCGYNFMSGKINRDRDRLSRLDEEKQMVTQIWEESILKNSVEIADIYTNILQDHSKCAETLWTCDRIAKPPIEVVWKRLRESKPNAFFHSKDQASSKTLTIEQVTSPSYSQKVCKAN